MMFRVTSAPGRRCGAQLEIRDSDDKVAWKGESNDERFDANDHITVPLRVGAKYRIDARIEDRRTTKEFTVEPKTALISLELAPEKTSAVLNELRTFLAQDREARPSLKDAAFARTPLSRSEAENAGKLLYEDHVQMIRKSRDPEMKDKVLKIGELEMRFDYKLFGDAPAEGRALFISMHGGGGAPKQVNDQQWENQKRLYKLEEGVYVAPRAPTDTWDLWHQGHIDKFFDRLIENLVVFENVNPNRVYLMGYSAGGDGVYQVAPRMADRWAAAAMMAGHPNESSPLGLRNLPFTIHVGGKDTPYNRNKVAAEWGEKLKKLRDDDPQGYEHWVEIYADKAHWLDRQDAAAIPWMAKFQRQTFPARVVWYQDDVTEPRFYWLAVDDDQRKAGTKVTAALKDQSIEVSAEGLQRIRVRLNDQMANLDEPIAIKVGGESKFSNRVDRTIATLAQSLAERGDPRSLFSAEVEVQVSAAAPP